MANYFYEGLHEQILKAYQEGYPIAPQETWQQLYTKLQQPKRWTITLEILMKEFITSSIELEKHNNIKNIMKVYKNVTQIENTDSLNTIIKFYRDSIEKKFEELIKGQTIPQDINEIDVQESPEDLLFFNYNQESKVKRDKIKEILKMRLNCYKTVIETIKTNSRCQDFMTSTVNRCLEFLEKYNRKNELNKFVNTIVGIHNNTYKIDRKKFPTYIDLTNKETQEIQLEIRFKVYELCKKMGLGQCCFRLIEDIKKHIMERQGKKDETKKRFLSMYYESLSEIFWNSQYYNFHAIFFLKHFEFLVKYNQQGNEHLVQQKADNVVLSILSIPFNTIDLKLSGEKFNKIRELILDNQKYVPSQQELVKVIKSQNILDLCTPQIQKIYELVAADNLNVFTVSKNLSENLSTISQSNSQFTKLIKDKIAFRVIVQLSSIYSTLKIERLKQLINFISESELISILLEAGQIAHMNCQIDFRKNVIEFGKTNRIESASGSLSLFAEKCKKLVLKITPENPVTERQKKEVRSHIQEAESHITDRLKEIKSLKTHLLKIQSKELNREEYEKQEMERLRREEIERQIKRQQIIEKQRKLKIEEHLRIINLKIKEIIQIKDKQVAKIGGIKIEDLTDEDKLTIDQETLVELKNSIQELVANDVQDRAKKMFQKYDYISREQRIVENEAVAEISTGSPEENAESVKKAQQNFEKIVQNKEVFEKTRLFKEYFFSKVLQMRQKKHTKNMEEFIQQCEKFRPEIEQRARTAYEDDKKEREAQEAEEKKKKEEDLQNQINTQDQAQKDIAWRNNKLVPDVIKPQEEEEEEKEDKNAFSKGSKFQKGGAAPVAAASTKQDDFKMVKGGAAPEKGGLRDAGWGKGAAVKKETTAGGWGKGKITEDSKKPQQEKQEEKQEDGWRTAPTRGNTQKKDMGFTRNTNNNNNKKSEGGAWGRKGQK